MRTSILLLTLAPFTACDSDKGVTRFNAAPTANITSHMDGVELSEGVTIQFEGTVTDPDHDVSELEAMWSVNGTTICDYTPAGEEGRTVCEHIIAEEDNEVSLIVKDPESSTGNAAISFTVSPTDAPTAEIQNPTEDGVYYSDQKITFMGVVDDTEDSADELVVNWKTDTNGDLGIDSTPSTNGDVQGYAYLDEGQHAVELHVVDTTGKNGFTSVVIDVGPPNSLPTCEITAPLDLSAGPEGELVIFEGVRGGCGCPGFLHHRGMDK